MLTSVINHFLNKEIIITYYKESEMPHQIAFIENGVYEYVGPYEEKYHSEYLAIATKKIIE